MREYKLEVIVKLDDEGYLAESNWILDAIQEQLQDGEEIVKYRLTEIDHEMECGK